LKGVQAQQMSEGLIWGSIISAGYLDFVLDDRDAKYTRYYVGQSNQIEGRIQTHKHNISQRNNNTLHYYIIAMGEGHRRPNFLSLWSLPQGHHVDEKKRQRRDLLFNNILETVFCRAFESLPAETLQNYFGPSEKTTGYSGVGLNVAPPVLQGVRLDSLQTMKFKISLAQSSDPEIRKWPEVRRNQNHSRPHLNAKPQSPGFDRNSFIHAVKTSFGSTHLSRMDLSRFGSQGTLAGESSNNGIRTLVDRCWTTNGLAGLDQRHIAYPFGSLSASIGIILDFGGLGVDSDQLQIIRNSEKQTLVLPCGLEKCGLTQKNSLIWTFSFRQDVSQPLQGSVAHQERGVPVQCNHELIQASSLRVVLLCGRFAEETISSQKGVQGPFNLTLQRYSYRLYGQSDGSTIHRLYITCPSPAALAGPEKWITSQTIGEVLKFAASLTDTKGLRYSFYECGIVTLRIIRRHVLEEQGYDKMDSNNIEPGIRSWLYSIGFEDDADIVALETAGGYLTFSLMMLLQAIPRLPRTTKQTLPPKIYTGEKRQFSTFPPDAFQAVKDLYQRKKEERYAKFITRVLNLDEAALYTNNTAEECEPEEYSELDGLINDNPLEYESEVVIDADGTMTEKRVPLHPRKAKKHINKDPRTSLLSGTAIYSGAEYHGSMQIFIQKQHLYLTQPFWGQMVVKAELTPKGTKHPNAFVMNATEPEPAARLALCVTGRDSEGEVLVEWARNSRVNATDRDGGFVKWLEG
jgi:hypothetical protein